MIFFPVFILEVAFLKGNLAHMAYSTSVKANAAQVGVQNQYCIPYNIVSQTVDRELPVGHKLIFEWIAKSCSRPLGESALVAGKLVHGKR